jgi:hypothetical protein
LRSDVFEVIDRLQYRVRKSRIPSLELGSTANSAEWLTKRI